MREFDLLEHVYAASANLGPNVLIPPGDDMGMVRLARHDLLAAVDQLIDGRHVQLNRTPLNLVGRKAITRSLSDIAAMAARPVASLVAVTLPPDFGSDRATQLFDAMRETAAHYDCPLIGGDIAFHSDPSHPLVCSVTVLAEPGKFAPITRRGAKIGDAVYVTGRLGGSLQPEGLGRHLTFEPRIREALSLASALRDRLHAMIDLSDGLGRDVSHIAELSDIGIELDAQAIPCNEGCDWRRSLGDGEDYELCFAASGQVPRSIDGLPITPVGRVVPFDGKSRVVVMERGREISADQLGWQHQS
jgi:thiamine-monophosphate kinase